MADLEVQKAAFEAAGQAVVLASGWSDVAGQVPAGGDLGSRDLVTAHEFAVTSWHGSGPALHGTMLSDGNQLKAVAAEFAQVDDALAAKQPDFK